MLTEPWQFGTASVRPLHERLGARQGLVYTATAKVVDRLLEKRLRRRSRKGNAFLYRPRIPREEVERARARHAVTRLLGSTPHAAVAALVGAVDSLDPSLLEELEQAVIARRKSKHGA